jgi:hypothetical protein
VKKQFKDALHRYKVEAFKVSHHGPEADALERDIGHHTKEALDNAYHFDFHKFHQDASPATIASFDRIRHFTTEAILPPVVEKLMRRIVVLEKQHSQLVDLLDDLLEMLSEDDVSPIKVARG